jgi:hypothetical protein
MLPDFVIFSRLEPLLFDTETAIIPPHIRDIFGPFQLASTTGGQTQTTGGQTPNDRECSNNGPRRFFRHALQPSTPLPGYRASASHPANGYLF